MLRALLLLVSLCLTLACVREVEVVVTPTPEPTPFARSLYGPSPTPRPVTPYHTPTPHPPNTPTPVGYNPIAAVKRTLHAEISSFGPADCQYKESPRSHLILTAYCEIQGKNLIVLVAAALRDGQVVIDAREMIELSPDYFRVDICVIAIGRDAKCEAHYADAGQVMSIMLEPYAVFSER